ncbi:MAG: hypothetical protein FWC36_02305 [Spirochaetes bacterium]|nr:hypothetical protein [Spirochaetota bacterium]
MQENFDQNQYEFHYKREERFARMPSHLRDNPKGFYQNNKPLVIIFANLILAIIIFGGFFAYENFIANRNFHPDFNFTLNGYIFDNNMLITLSIRKKENSALPEDELLPFEATITLSDNRDFNRRFFDILPAKPNEEVVLRTSVPIFNHEIQRNSTIFATIAFSGQIISLKSRVKSEK